MGGAASGVLVVGGSALRAAAAKSNAPLNPGIGPGGACLLDGSCTIARAGAKFNADAAAIASATRLYPSNADMTVAPLPRRTMLTSRDLEITVRRVGQLATSNANRSLRLRLTRASARTITPGRI